MKKYDIAQYLANLHTLMEAQESTGLHKSGRLVDEYNRVWEQLKEEINNETRNIKQPIGLSQAGAGIPRR